ncbi:transcriptional regulator [Dehalococcoides mccartyi]|uniref:Transcriptional regulator n=1 Tax=Dehalococcoides mccartyi TaxID=61435 RepID=A0A0V8M2Y4_9CHLR|nr:response regulator transcription factor [Dehalococcoides mccartyi]KSV18104.1 transcriptional regulator [Dehalococcoides mccartyi]
MRILLLDDDKCLCQTLERALSEAGHVVEYACDGASGEYFAANSEFDLLILDIGLPDKNGIEVCRKLRADGIVTPVLMLTARDSLDSKVKGLDAGADDYLCKPFACDELFARIRALQRRPPLRVLPVVETAGISFDNVSHRVCGGKTEIKLTAAEYKILEYFITNPGVLITRSMLEEHLWGAESTSVSNTIDSLIKKLRQKLGWDAKSGPIKTLRGAGYRLDR